MTVKQKKYKQTIRELSDRIVEAQRPVRILDAVKWDAGVQEDFFKNKFRKQPSVNRAYYEQRSLGFDPVEKREQFHDIERDAVRLLGQFNPVGAIIRRMCQEYQMTVRMLEARGSKEFSSISQELYGSAADVFHAGDSNLADLGGLMAQYLVNIDKSPLFAKEEKTIPGEQAVGILQKRLDLVFSGFDNNVRVLLSDGIVADAAAGSDYLKVRKEAFFTERDIRLLEIHEGWVHLGTTLNGQYQPVCTFLSKGPPSSTITQEGLAILMEIISFSSYPSRLHRLTNRVRAVHMAEEGASFLEVFQFFRDQGFNELESYANTTRVYRGSTPTGAPFTKDLSYHKGFVLVYNYIQLAVQKGKLDRIPLLFCGKSTLEDLRPLASLVEEGIVEQPRFLPPQFADLNALAAFMCYSNFLNQLNLRQMETDYLNIL
ncbi:MAG: flavohemoglobin expression-modulating QEGLA motif protein [SAR324 cluster bacterium]|nr:flavohemoglobin expression-modulating QEGLA motif protein [SAR324 cluster bacterium]